MFLSSQFYFYIGLLIFVLIAIVYFQNKCIYNSSNNKLDTSKSKKCSLYIYKKDRAIILKIENGECINFSPYIMNYSIYDNKSITHRKQYYGYVAKENDINTIIVKYKRTNRLAFKILLRDSLTLTCLANISVMNVKVIDSNGGDEEPCKTFS